VSAVQVQPPPDLAWLQALVSPQAVAAWSLQDWDRVVRLARRHRLLARLACRIEAAGLTDAVPPAVLKHLVGAQQLSQARTRAMLWAIEQLPGMLDHPAYPLVLLKGAAYVGQGLPIAEGRLPSDLDILLPKQKLPEVRFRLAQAGWREPALDEHDRRYYLEWSHELPPLQHARFAVELDVHHNILPQRAGRVVDASLLFARLVPSQWPAWQVLSPVDQLLHSAAHLFYDAEPCDRVRDLVDMDGLFRYFGNDAGFWAELPKRAAALGLLEPLALACHFTQAWLGTPIPATLRGVLAEAGPSASRRLWLYPLMASVLRPAEPDRTDPLGKRLATTAVLARYHWNRLPMRVLLPHLWRKWLMGMHRSAGGVPTDGAKGP
jgi:hypothetical protein